MTSDESTKNASHFINLVLNLGLRAAEDVTTETVCIHFDVEAMHIYDMPVYDPEIVLISSLKTQSHLWTTSSRAGVLL